jgi:CheY-like chemotaxis protein
MAATTDHRCTVLVVDDDPEIRELLRLSLTGDGYQVAGAPNGREALHYLRSHAEICMIVLDLSLPVMDGAQFRRAQLLDRSLAWIPVVVMSAMVDTDRRARELGARHVLRKPLDLDEVRETLRRVGCCQARPRAARGAPVSSL